MSIKSVIASEAKQSRAWRVLSWIASPYAKWLRGTRSLGFAMTVLFFSFPSYADDEVLKKKVENYLNSLTTLSADFTQIDAEGNTSGGKFFLKRPGKFKWEYDQRQPILIISDGSQLVYYDKKLKEVSYVSVENSLANFLARKNIVLSGDVKLISIEDKNNMIRAKVMQRDKPDQGALTMFFDDKDMRITMLEVTDVNGSLTKIIFENEQFGQQVADKTFVFHDPKFNKNVWDKD